MNEVLQKELDKNYAKVQKREMKVKETSEKLLADYDKKIKELATALKAENKELQALDKKFKDEHKETLKSLKADFKTKNADFNAKIKEANATYNAEIKKADEVFLKEETKLNGLIEKAKNADEKEIANVLKEKDKNLANLKKELEKIEANFVSDTEKLDKKLNDRKEKYDEKVASLKEKRDEKIAKLNETSQNKIAKLNNDIEEERAKKDKQLADLVPIFKKKMAEIDELLSGETDEYENKTGNIKATLDSKVTRRNKFLEKAENEGDSKAAKQQRKEIKQLQLNAERELKILKTGFEDRNKDLFIKKREINVNNLEKIAAIDKDFTSYSEDNLMQVEMNKVSLAHDITKAKLDTDLKLQDELSKFNEFEVKHKEVVAETLKEKEALVAIKEDEMTKLLIEFDQTNEVNVSKLKEEIASKKKELKIAEIRKDSDYTNSKIKLDTEINTLESEQRILERQLELDIEMNDANLELSFYKNDFDKQAAVKNEFLHSQNVSVELAQSRAKEILEFEELEVENRANLKIKFLEEQQKKNVKDLVNLRNRADNSFEGEKAFFESEIAILSDNDKSEIAEFRKKKELEIETLVEEKNKLDQVAEKKKIKELSDKIGTMRNQLVADLREKEDVVTVKVRIFQDNLEAATRRKELALQEIKEMHDAFETDIKYAIELINQNKEAELQEAKARYAKTLQNSNNFMNLATNRNAVTTEEHTKYLTDREDTLNRHITSIKSEFENFKNNVNTAKDEKMSDLDVEKNVLIERVKRESLREEEKLEAVIREVAALVKDAGAKAAERISVASKELSAKNRESSEKAKQAVTVANQEFKQKENEYKNEVVQIDKKQNVETKSYEAEKSRVQKEHDIELKKEISKIKLKLDTDIKAL